MDWHDFENVLFNKDIYTIDNNSSLNIVLFGSCHMSTIGFILNKMLNYRYNIHIVISWFFEHNGFERFDMNHVNTKIQNLIKSANIFLYHKHINDYGISASKITSFLNTDCTSFLVPNYRLDLNDNYNKSINCLNDIIINSDFPEFDFVVKAHKFICFFNTQEHPTHYLLFLQSQSIVNKLLNNGCKINIDSYYDISNRNYFKTFYLVFLPGNDVITEEISKKTNILQDSDYFDSSISEYFILQDSDYFDSSISEYSENKNGFDWIYYLNNNDDLKHMTKSECLHHWETHGKFENRIHKFNN